MTKKYKLATLGCRTNQYETLAYQNQLEAAGYQEAKADEEADLCIVNTCTVTQSADSHSRHQIRKFRKKYPKARIAVTGCMVEKSKNQLLEIKEADHVISNLKKDQLLFELFPEEKFPEFKISEVNSQTRAFVKVQDGCNSFCSYCIIPYVRGRSKSRTLPSIQREIEDLAQAGTKEIVLTGINIGDFDGGNPKNPVSLAKLIKQVRGIEGIERIRISSIDPDEVDEELIEVILQTPKLCPSMHIVLQSGSNWILKRMNRKYSKQMFFETIDKLYAANKDFTFTTDVIVGFPGERRGDFEQTLEVISQVKFAKVHMFPYSRRQRTKAALFEDQIDPKEMTYRKNEILRLSEKVAFELRQRFVGRKMQILTEKSEQNEKSVGYSPNFLKVYLSNAHIPPNQIVSVKMVENTPAGLVGKIVL